jgi:hypothetical protein
MDDLAKEVRRLASIEEIRNLIHEYPQRIDRGDLDGVARLFGTGKVTFGSGRVIEGEEALRDWFTTMVITYEGGATHVQHLVGNIIIEILDEDHARATSYYRTCQCVEPDFPLQTIIAGRYDDRFERVDGRWQFAERRFLRDYVRDTSFHVRPNALTGTR